MSTMDAFEEARNDALTISGQYVIRLEELAAVRGFYSTQRRLMFLLPLLAMRLPGQRFTHQELAWIVGASREKVTRAIQLLRESIPATVDATTRRMRRS